jgi:hypothetical protein
MREGECCMGGRVAGRYGRLPTTPAGCGVNAGHLGGLSPSMAAVGGGGRRRAAAVRGVWVASVEDGGGGWVG